MSSGQLTSRVRAGVLKKLLPRTYAFSGYPDTWKQRAIGAQIWAGDGAALSGLTAARIWSLTDERSITEVTTVRDIAPPRSDVRVHRAIRWRSTERVRRGPFVVTHVSRTLIDLAAAHDEETAETALNIALHKRLVTFERLSRYVAGLPRGTRGLARMKEMLQERSRDGSIPTNKFETKFSRILRAAGLPAPVAQHPISRPSGKRAYIDFAYPSAMVAIETDGFGSHGDYGAWARDRARRNELEVLGWRVLHITWRDLRQEPDAVVELVRAMLYPTMFGS